MPHDTERLTGQVSVRDFGVEAQRAAEAHLAACQEALYSDEDDVEKIAWPETAGPFCGCDTCIVREVLWAAWKVIDEYVLDAMKLIKQ